MMRGERARGTESAVLTMKIMNNSTAPVSLYSRIKKKDIFKKTGVGGRGK